MAFETRSALWAALVAAALLAVGCGPAKPKPDGGTDGGGGASCIEDEDCPDSTLFFCNTAKAECEPACRTKADCSATRRGVWALDYCAGSRGCECDEGKCVASLCSADADCGAQVCRNGQCVAPPALTEVATCQVSPDLIVLKVGAKAKFSATTMKANKEPVVIKEGATWAAVGSALTGSGTGHSVEMTAASPTSGTAAVDSVEATFGTVKCRAKAIVLPATVPANQVAVVVTDELSGRPIPGAKVMVSKPDGSVVQQGGASTVDTDAKGYATASLGGASTFSVSAFHLDYSYMTIANYTAAGGADANFLSLVLRRNQVDKYGGYKGTLKNVPATGNVHVGIASMSLAGSITNLSITQLLGPSVPTDVQIGTINEPGVKIPAGAYLGFTDQKIKDQVSAQGLAGVCVDANGAPDEAKIAAGECGTRTAWTLAGDIPLSDLPISAFTSGAELDVPGLLAQITPIFKKFSSSVIRDVQFSLQPSPCSIGEPPTTVACGTPGSEYNLSNTGFFTTADLEFAQVPLAFNFVAKLSEMPKYRSTWVDGVFALGGSNVIGRGVVPLGLGVGVNTAPNDALLDCAKAGTPPVCILPVGTLPIRMAPTHHGLEGSEYGLVLLAISAKGITDVSAGLAASALFVRIPENKLVFDPNGATPLDLSGSAYAFPAFPEGAKYNYVDTALPGLAGRTFKLASAIAGVGVVRVSFTDGMEHRWDVMVDAAQATNGFTLPKPPGVFADRTFTNATATKRSPLLVQAFRLSSNPAVTTAAAIGFNGLVEFNSTNADRITNLLTAFSFIDYGAPSVSFDKPKENPATVAKSSKLVVKVKSFKVGTAASDDGVVLFTFRDGTGPVAVCPDAKVATETTTGNGVLEYALPATCVGSGLKVKATLMRPDGATPLAPEVSTEITATIQ